MCNETLSSISPLSVRSATSSTGLGAGWTQAGVSDKKCLANSVLALSVASAAESAKETKTIATTMIWTIFSAYDGALARTGFMNL